MATRALGPSSVALLFAVACAADPELEVREAAACPVQVDAGLVASKSFELDVMPILQRSCALATCHKKGTSAGGLSLGPPSAEGPPDAAERAVIHADLLLPSKAARAVRRIAPGAPEQSLLMLKLDACQSSVGLDCELRKCGGPMPSNAPQLDLATRNVVRQWIASGASAD